MTSLPRALALLLLLTASCGDDTATPEAIVRVSPEAAGPNCAHGGQAVSSGIDRDRDGVLDDVEVQGTQYVCSDAEAPALVRSDVEPAGEHCARGGAAVRSGLDRNRDGALADGEVSSTTYVCKDALLPPLTRFDRELPGPHCAAGGTAVRTGLDRDADRVLADAEIDATSYVCDDAELTRVDVVAAGARCRAGGAAVHGGPDRDGDGVLGDAEIARTEYVCGTVIDGDVDVDVQADVDALRDIQAITGDLKITYASGVTSVDLPALRVVGGELAIDYLTNAASISAPALRAVSGGLTVRSIPNLTTLDLPALKDAKWIDVNRNAALATVRLPSLTYMAGSIALRGNPITELDLSALVSARGLSLWDIRVANLSLPELELTDDFDVVDATTTSISAPRLRYVLGTVRIGRNPELRTIALPGVELVQGTMTFRDMPHLVELALPQLDTLGGDFNVWSNAALERLSTPPLRTISGSFSVTGNTALASFSGLSGLYSVEGHFFFKGNRAMTDMSGLASLVHIGGMTEIGDTRLRRLGMPRLSDVEIFNVGRVDETPLADNPLMETIDLPRLQKAESLIVGAAPQLTRLDLPELEIVNGLVSFWDVPRMRRCDLEAFVQALAQPPEETQFVQVDDSPCQ